MSSCRTSRPRVAPSESRTEISFCRVVARERSRFATLAQTISSTSATTTLRIVAAAQIGRADVVDAVPGGVHEQVRNLGPVAVARLGTCGIGQALEVAVETGPRGVLEHAFEVALHLLRRRSGLQAAHDLQPPVGWLGQPRLLGVECVDLRHERQGQADVRRLPDRLLHAGEVWRQYADNRDGDVADTHRLADDGRVSHEARVPVLRADHHDRRRGRLVVFGKNRAPDTRGDAERLVVVAARDEGRGDLRLAVDHRADPAERRKRHQFAHRLVVGEELLIHRIGERRPDVLAVLALVRVAVVARAGDHVVAAAPAEAHQRARVLDGDLRQQQRVDAAENRRVGADAQGQREDDDGRPALGMEQHARRVAKILEHSGLLRRNRSEQVNYRWNPAW